MHLPDPLYRDVHRVAREQDWSMAEVIRRSAEAMTRVYPPIKGGVIGTWRFPPPIGGKLLITDPVALREAVQRDLEA